MVPTSSVARTSMSDLPCLSCLGAGPLFKLKGFDLVVGDVVPGTSIAPFVCNYVARMGCSTSLSGMGGGYSLGCCSIRQRGRNITGRSPLGVDSTPSAMAVCNWPDDYCLDDVRVLVVLSVLTFRLSKIFFPNSLCSIVY